MPTATLTSQGRITLPLAVRKALGLEAGDEVDFVPETDGARARSALRRRRSAGWTRCFPIKAMVQKAEDLDVGVRR